MKTLLKFALIAGLPLAAAACSGAEPEAAPSDTATASPAAVAPVAPAAPAATDAVVGKWIDDENDAYSFAADGTISSAGQVSMTGSWKADGADRYAVDLNSPAGLAKGVACISGDTMAMVIGDGSTTHLGRVGADGRPAAPDTSVKCA